MKQYSTALPLIFTLFLSTSGAVLKSSAFLNGPHSRQIVSLAASGADHVQLHSEQHERATEGELASVGVGEATHEKHSPHGDSDDSDEMIKVKNPAIREAWPALLMSLIAGLSTVLGALIVFCLPAGGPNPFIMSFGLSLAAGVMITVSIVELWPHDGFGNYLHWVVFACGGILCFVICKCAEWVETKQHEPEPSTFGPDGDEISDKRKHGRLAWLLFVSLTMHNFPEGLAVAISSMHSTKVGLVVMIAIAVHNIPEGIAICISTYASTKSRMKAVTMSFLSGLTEPLGALCAILVLWPYLTPSLVEFLMILVAGVMTYIAVFELLPESVSQAGWAVPCLGVVVGAVIMLGTHMLLDEH